jgi:hypothetical protein
LADPLTGDPVGERTTGYTGAVMMPLPSGMLLDPE